MTEKTAKKVASSERPEEAPFRLPVSPQLVMPTEQETQHWPILRRDWMRIKRQVIDTPSSGSLTQNSSSLLFGVFLAGLTSVWPIVFAREIPDLVKACYSVGTGAALIMSTVLFTLYKQSQSGTRKHIHAIEKDMDDIEVQFRRNQRR